ncbi:hypothetical protein A3A76_03145 [Candidatus Woesebacteria bacterium RIFCSPLOWO2_01_FULL_39_23]|uniref:Putative phage metallopeptidase domain-containing protein n=1 Tax=Candidatus Woesebacteria bacterium RIFCSPHIGHO2_01_FULL_40_22 TaxID=1802499 RepID=A0A1F7YJK8_9BACT|nr:MAG: hypothetical protein A2141_00880 [Candidatus Woesebacteria bacterium RBG_16_40_11]OGM27457.1 MAG: hypothetical protein A2628_01545 [Candidatus Woesebacteria bacterium RIFCSPHIGHO2_01_FULL_40_22]OGM36585.1 MAG: hypothetical protein A3E41_04100 [Candidatus Woesebacteria bacterium RIFCSPHIGHO2_12_FULL_38_9]OGM62631.1 MAG: hypothetical protein A3A76_03145 [Candidatus Woesebacteria bacterium RIFCSPLOWO2_01_FULL_39_23]
MRKKKWVSVDWKHAPDIKKRVKILISSLDLSWLKSSDIYTFRSTTSSTRAYARIWGLSRVWQLALKTNPSYIVEVISQRFDKLPIKEQDKVLLHELAHIPKNFSGSLLPHTRSRGKRNFHDRVDELFAQYLKNIKY